MHDGEHMHASRRAALRPLLRSAGVDALLVVPQDELRSAPALRRAWAAGLIVVSYDRALVPKYAARYVSHHYTSSQQVLGYETGRYLAAVCKALGMEVWATKRTPITVSTTPEPLPAPEELVT